MIIPSAVYFFYWHAVAGTLNEQNNTIHRLYAIASCVGCLSGIQNNLVGWRKIRPLPSICQTRPQKNGMESRRYMGLIEKTGRNNLN